MYIYGCTCTLIPEERQMNWCAMVAPVGVDLAACQVAEVGGGGARHADALFSVRVVCVLCVVYCWGGVEGCWGERTQNCICYKPHTTQHTGPRTTRHCTPLHNTINTTQTAAAAPPAHAPARFWQSRRGAQTPSASAPRGGRARRRSARPRGALLRRRRSPCRRASRQSCARRCTCAVVVRCLVLDPWLFV